MFTSSNSAATGFPIGRKIFFIGAAIFFAVGALIYFLFDPTQVSIFPPCMFHQLTGLDCPGCGAQRALHQLLHGNLVAAFRLNAMFVLSLPLLAWLSPRFIAHWTRRKPLRFQTHWLWFYLAAWILFGLLRNLPFPICAWFAA